MQGMNEQIYKFLSYELMLYLVHIIPFPNNSLLKLAANICTEFKKAVVFQLSFLELNSIAIVSTLVRQCYTLIFQLHDAAMVVAGWVVIPISG